jgi:predicted nuclease of predicted toxin-antitoxin system
VKFLVDRCAGATLAQWLRSRGHDVAEARERGPDPGDEQLLAQAFAERRVLVTLDKDFGALVFAKGQPHSGVVRLPDTPAAERVRLFERLLATHEKDMADGTVVTVRGDRVRISR